METGLCKFFEDKYLPFNFRHVLVCSCKVGMYANCGEFTAYGDKFSINQSGGDLEATLGVKFYHRLCLFDEMRELPTWDGFQSCKLDVTANDCIERDVIDKKGCD